MKLARLLLLVVCVPAAHATGPNLPLQFEDDRFAARIWSTSIRVNPKEVAPPKVTREIYQAGERLSGEPLRLKPAAESYKDGAQLMEVPLRNTATTRLKAGVYAQRITVEASWLDKNNSQPLHIERWYYFQVRGKNVVRLSPEEYERLTDPARKDAIAPEAAPRSYLGGGQPDATPLAKTSRSAAIRADSVAAVSEEHPPQSAKGYQLQNEKADRSEEQEP